MLILRSDYMLDKENDSLKLVEFNTIAAALTSLSNKVFEVQYQILDKYSEDLIPSYS
jgi:D-alanine-D-alanine ligase-like ATP-grasp enzyme